MATNPTNLAAAESWFKQHRTWMTRRAASKLPLSQSEDAVQDTFVRVLRRGELDQIRDPAAYLSESLTHQMAGSWRRRSSREIPVAELEVDSAPSDDVGTQLERQEDRDRLRDCVGRLPIRQRRAIELLLQGKTRAEISAQLQLSGRGVTMLLARGKVNLKRHLLRQGYLPALFPFRFSWLRSKISSACLRSGDLVSMGEIYALSVALIVSLGFSVPATNTFTGGVERGTSQSTTQNDSNSPRGLNPSEISEEQSGEPRPPLDGSSARSTVTRVDYGNTELWVDKERREGPPEPPLQDQLREVADNPEKVLPICPQTTPCPWDSSN